MNHPLSSIVARQPRTRATGFALVLVLGCLVLILILVVGLLTRVGIERNSSNAYSSTTSARQLSEVAINLVQGQITAATTQGGNVTWASQPGMVRTFGTQTEANGRAKMLHAYKLYSATTLVQDKISLVDGNLTEDLPPADWAASPGIWADLNEPIVLKVDGVDQQIFPIFDPKAGTSLGVEGYVPRGFAEKLPVRWLYVLKDGSMKACTAAGTTVTVAGATESNPVVGRIAFWADDDTCKININTAGIGRTDGQIPSASANSNTLNPVLNGAEPELYWDVPRFMTFFDRNLMANAQPARNEFTRYPGHPAWTTLSMVFPGLSMSAALSDNLLPRYQWGGTRGGSRRADAAIMLTDPPPRLFATVDEFIFTPARTAISYSPGDLQKLRFFLTANSRSPEMNLFNLPRVACWPVADASLGDTYRTAYDKLIAFCSSMKGRAGGTKPNEPYYFQRKNAYSCTEDFAIARNLQLYEYLQRLTQRSIPGFGGNFKDKFTEPERNQVLTSIVDYIRCANLFDDNLAANKQFTKGINNATRFFQQPSGHGQAMPLRHPTNGTQGFGRFYTVSEFAIHFIATADGSGIRKGPPALGPLGTGQPATLADLGGSVEALLDNDAKLLSNIATGPYANRTLGGTRLQPTEKRIEAMIHLEFFCPALGNRAMISDMSVQVEGLDSFAVNGKPLGFPATGVNQIRAAAGNTWSSSSIGGFPGVRLGLMPNDITTDQISGKEGLLKRSPARGVMAADAGLTTSTSSSSYNAYPFLSIPITIDASAGTMSFTGGDVTIKIYGNSSGGDTTAANLIQTINLKVPGGTFPIPNLVSCGTSDGWVQGDGSSVSGAATNRSYWWTFSRDGVTPGLTSAPQATLRGLRYGMSGASAWNAGRLNTFSLASQLLTYNGPYEPSQPVATKPWGPALFRGGPVIADGLAPALTNVDLAWPASPAGAGIVSFPAQTGAGSLLFSKGFDVVRSLIPKHGDYRLIAGLNDVADSEFVVHPDWNDTSKMFACNLWEFAPLNYLPTFPTDPGTPIGFAGQIKAHPEIRLVKNVTYGGAVHGGVMAPDIIPNYVRDAAADINPSATGDFDNGIVFNVDGPYINKPEEGNALYSLTGDFGPGSTHIPYFDFPSYTAPLGSVLFSPNRIMPSPGMFGSLSTGIRRSQPWQTLLLRPQPGHPNVDPPPDHLLLDLFWMPVVEPYAISDPFATAGKVNMNSQLMPFTWIERTTALRAVFKGERLIVVPNSQAPFYKSPTVNSVSPQPATPKTYRQPLFIDNTTSTIKDDTMQNFHTRFAEGDIFRSPTEICGLWMVPEGSKLSDMATFWDDKRLTGDESRERIYATILPRLTTKSNTYTVHVRAQTLQKTPSTAPGEWVEGMDVVKGEYRGSTTIERYLDPNDESIPDYATDPAATFDKPLDQFYKWRQLQTVDFNY